MSGVSHDRAVDEWKRSFAEVLTLARSTMRKLPQADREYILNMERSPVDGLVVHMLLDVDAEGGGPIGRQVNPHALLDGPIGD